MAAAVPPSLKAADIARFAHRAAQLEKAKPIVAYWCDYWIVNQILSKGLHNADQDALTYTTNMMDKLEKVESTV
jgi:vacuolar protein sorting-associated protein VTA1